MTLSEQTVVVVGGGSGIGRGVARACLARGARVVLVGRTREKLEQSLTTLEAGERGRAIVADITLEADVVRLFEQLPSVNHVVVTAAQLAYQPIRDFQVDAARRALDSKILGALLIAKHA